MKNTEAQTASTVKAFRNEHGKYIGYQCLTCGKTIKFWGTIHNHMTVHGVPVVLS